jgi:hypothetical protein
VDLGKAQTVTVPHHPGFADELVDSLLTGCEIRSTMQCVESEESRPIWLGVSKPRLDHLLPSAVASSTRRSSTITISSRIAFDHHQHISPGKGPLHTSFHLFATSYTLIASFLLLLLNVG